MNILFVSEEGKGLGLCYRCQKEGFHTTLYTELDNTVFIGNGIVNKTKFGDRLLQRNNCDIIASSILQLLDETKPDLVVVDGTNFGKVADFIREQHLNVVGPSFWTDTLHKSSSYREEVLDRVGMYPWNGADGLPLTIGCWWNGTHLIYPFIVWNETHFLSGGLGPHIESASHIMYLLNKESWLFKDSFGRLEQLLKKNSFKGYLLLSTIIQNKQLYITDISTSFTFMGGLLELYKGNVVDMLVSLSTCRQLEGKFTHDYATSLLLSIPPYPHIANTGDCVEIKGLNEHNLSHVYPIDCQIQGDKWFSAYGLGNLMYVCARGRDVSECKRRIFKTLSNINVDNGQHTIDFTNRYVTYKKLLKL